MNGNFFSAQRIFHQEGLFDRRVRILISHPHGEGCEHPVMAPVRRTFLDPLRVSGKLFLVKFPMMLAEVAFQSFGSSV